MQVDRSEALRYLGCRTEEPAMLAAVEKALQELGAVAAPRWLYRILPLERPAEGVLALGGLTIESQGLARHLQGCRQAALFAATLGAPVDRLLAARARTGMSGAVVVQAAAAAMIEAYCDECCQQLQRELPPGLYQRPRFSPGYGDLPLPLQPALLALLDAPKRIGLTATESCMLAPSKSVTAFIGLTREQESCHTAKCAACPNTDCPFRKV